MIPKCMRAVVLTGHGGLDKLVYREDLPVPRPASGEVLIRVRACAVNNTDINTRTGWYGASVKSGITEELANKGAGEASDLGTWDRKSLAFPRIQGAASAGTIMEVGAGIDRGRIGQTVVVDPVVRDPSLPALSQGVSYIGSEQDGGYAELMAVPAVNALAVSADLPFDQLACLPCAYQTAEEMQRRVHLAKGDVVLVTGASGGVGAANVQLALLKGARVIAVASRDKHDRIRSLGAEHCLDRSEPLGPAVEALMGERGIDVVLDVTGADPVRDMWHALRRAGRYATGGAIAGPMANIDLRDLIYKDLQVAGIANPEPEAMRNLIGLVSTGKLEPIVDATYPLEDLATAQAKFASKQHIGKIVITI